MTAKVRLRGDGSHNGERRERRYEERMTDNTEEAHGAEDSAPAACLKRPRRR